MAEVSLTVLYHSQCADGFAAACVARRYYGLDAIYVPVRYDQPPPVIPPEHSVLMVDFCYPLAVMRELCDGHTWLTVLDHHESSVETCKVMTAHQSCTVRHDIRECGATLAWFYLFPGDPVPSFLEYVRDQDLWRWELPGSRAVSAAVRSYGFDFGTWLPWLADSRRVSELQGQGVHLLRLTEELVRRQAAEARQAVIGGYWVPVVNASALQSEVGHALLEAHPLAPLVGVYHDQADGRRKWSLRGAGRLIVGVEGTLHPISCAVVAQMYGGGGHRDAAGFVVGPEVIQLEEQSGGAA